MRRAVDVKSALINMGKEYLLAEAFLTLATHEELKVFVTVSTEEEAAWIMKKFPKVILYRIIYVYISVG
jgi:hypothetical protein